MDGYDLNPYRALPCARNVRVVAVVSFGVELPFVGESSHPDLGPSDGVLLADKSLIGFGVGEGVGWGRMG